MEEWKTYKLGELADVTKLAGYEFTKYVHYIPDGDIIAIRALNLRDGLLDLSDVQRISKAVSDSLERSKLYYDDIVLSYTGTIGACAIIKEDGRFHLAPNVCKITSKAINADFLYYIIRSHWFQRQLKGFCHGSTQPTIPMKTIRELSVPVPPIRIQERINDLLVPLDAKIRINNLINLNLEEQAKALFKSWFVDFEPFLDKTFVDSEMGTIPDGWRVGTLSEVAHVTMGVSPSGKSYNTDALGDVFYQGRAEFGNRFPQRNLYTTEAKRFAEENSVLLSVRAPVGDINIAEEKCCIGRGLASIQSLYDTPTYLLYLMLSLKPELNKFNGEGTVFGSINKKDLEGLRILIPPQFIMQEFESIVCEFDKQILVLERESRTLSTLRDTLLPKLISGEIAV